MSARSEITGRRVPGSVTGDAPTPAATIIGMLRAASSDVTSQDQGSAGLGGQRS